MIRRRGWLLDPVVGEEQGGGGEGVAVVAQPSSEVAPPQGETPATPQETPQPPGEAKEGEPFFDLTAFEKGGDLHEVVSKKGVPSKEEPPKPSKKETPPPAKVPIEEGKKAPPPQEQTIGAIVSPEEFKRRVTSAPPPVASTRDEALAEFPAEEKELLKKMPNDVFNTVVPRLKELQKLQKQVAAAPQQQKQALPDSWFEHPQAYQLTPEFQQLQARAQQVGWEQQHWTEQLIKIKRGEDWEDFVQNEKGEWMRVTRKPSVDAEVEVDSYRNRAMQLVGQTQETARRLADGFKNYYGNLSNQVKSAEKQFFPDYEDEKHPSRPVIDNALKYFKERGLAGNILTPFMAKMYARLLEYQTALRDVVAVKEKEKGIEEDKKKAGPTKGSILAAGAGGSAAADSILDEKMFKF